MPNPQPFVHAPRPADVYPIPDNTTQRYFCNAKGNRQRKVLGGKGDHSSDTDFRVMRFADRDTADLDLTICSYGISRFQASVNLTPAELRELAQRLLDAAYDIETHPAALLEAQADHEAVPA